MDDFSSRGKTDWISQGADRDWRPAIRGLQAIVFDRSAGAGKHPGNVSKELDDGTVHKRKRSNKPDRQGEDGQAILKAHRSRLIYDKAPDKAFHRAGPSPTTKPQLIGFS
jgi:hypothetical protein